MKEEIIYGLIAAVVWSIYVIILKIVLKDNPLKVVLIFLGLGVFLASLVLSIPLRETLSFTYKAIILSIIAGILWFIGIFVVNYGLKKGLNLSIMAPIYNVNTLLVVLLSIALLKESVEYWKVILASILVTIAAILLS